MQTKFIKSTIGNTREKKESMQFLFIYQTASIEELERRSSSQHVREWRERIRSEEHGRGVRVAMARPTATTRRSDSTQSRVESKSQRLYDSRRSSARRRDGSGNIEREECRLN